MSEGPLQNLSFGGRKALPIIRQNEATECGNACLAMIATYYGFKTDTSGLRRRFPTSARGMTLASLAENAGQIGFTTRALKLEIEQIKLLRLPAIIHWDLNHFVVLKSAGRKRFTVHDPAKGALTLEYEGFSDHFTGIALELTPNSKFEKHEERTKLKFSSLWSSLRGLIPSLVQVLILSAVMQVYIIAAPQYMQMVIDTVLPNFDTSLLLTLAIGFFLFLLVNVTATVIRQLVILHAGTSMAYQISTNLFNKLVHLPLSFFQKRHVGDIVSRFTSIDPINKFLTDGVVLGLVDGVMAIVTLVLMLIYSPMLALVSIIALILYLVIRIIMFRAFRAATEELIITSAKENTNFMETIRGIQTVKSYAQETRRQQRWQNLLADSVNQSVRVQRLRILFETSNSVITGVEHIILVYLAARLVMTADLTIGMIFAFMAYRDQFVDKATGLVELLIDYRMLGLHLDRIADIAVAEVENRDGDKIDISSGELELKSIGFSYEKHLPPVFEDASISIRSGESVALVGPSGQGKTTLLKIMMGLFTPTSGEVFIDGKSLKSIELKSVRQQTASVMQDDALFAGSIAENISFFDPDPNLEFVMECARLAIIHDEIATMTMGYETLVGDMGSALSGGQVQRILLARAFYKKPKILFVDEGTSNLDVATERLVNASIKAMGITRILVAHRPETISSANRVFEISGGLVTETFPQEGATQV